MSSVISSRPTTRPSPVPEPFDLPRGTSETFTEVTPGSAIKVPSCKPTPLIGSWADESWPLNSRQASEIITEQVLQAQRSSIVFEDDEGNVLMGDANEYTENQLAGQETDSSVDEIETYANESMLHEAMSHAQHTEEGITHCDGESSQETLDSPVHVAQMYSFDPYNIQAATVVHFRCNCEVCVSMLQQKTHEEQLASLDTNVHQDESVSNQITPAVAQVTEPTGKKQSSGFAFPEAPASNEQDHDWDLPTYGQEPKRAPHGFQVAETVAPPQFHQFPAAAPSSSGFMTHTQISSPPYMEQVTPTASPGQMQATPSSSVSGLSHPPPTQRRVVGEHEKTAIQREVSTFMPPAPPPRISTMVFEEETNIKNPSGVYYHLIMRWYSRVQESQGYFVTPEEHCPAPNKEKYSFEEWADEVSGWWYTHFEHMQKKAPRFGAGARGTRRY